MTAAAMVARTSGAPRGPRNAAHKRALARRADKDGDLSMDGPSSSRGGITKSRAPAGTVNEGSHRSRAGPKSSRMMAEVRRHVSAGGDVTRRASAGRSTPSTTRLEELNLTGWADSKTTADTDSITKSLVAWIEKKATLKSPTKRPVAVKKAQVNDKILTITVLASDTGAILRLNGFVFAGANLTIERPTKDAAESQTTQNTIAMLRGVLARRYNPETKLLDLSALGQDPDLKASSIFDSSSTTSKFFPALMKVLDQQFESPSAKHDAIQSVSLANNDLPDLTTVTTLAYTVPKLKNLDLSNNKFSKIGDLDPWRRRFYHLDHLIISGNPIEQSEPTLAQTLTQWYRHLRILNTTQVRTDEEAAKAMQVTELPFPIRSPVFQDEGQIAETFIRTFFQGYDADRGTLATMYYSDQSDFSFAVNASALRDPHGDEPTAQPSWAAYIHNSRNLKKINHLAPRHKRLFKGAAAIAECWKTLPNTRHPDLAGEANKWSIECQLQPGLPDPSGSSSGGVDGFLITIHGEFNEIDSTGQSNAHRSFDRTFIIGPGGPAGVTVVNDMLTVRAYGGTQAFEPDDTDNNNTAIAQAGAPSAPAGLAPEVAEQMVVELQKQTNMTVAYVRDCLEQTAWDFDKALQTFAAVRANLPADAFIQQPIQ